jgi:hypothetical protein
MTILPSVFPAQAGNQFFIGESRKLLAGAVHRHDEAAHFDSDPFVS